ncbi:hypothetical protein [Polyangium sp. 6x1]|uniref:hypothetical protein n=1 Tax=Polyangium sp. 6x1 TaxID=3042689 RepID=UPI0024830E43|nr:hypothetical protein [Polyangium sp. 6x1]MDI1446697.1 hypothetical protein [Polyangium sp. 6x1]
MRIERAWMIACILGATIAASAVGCGDEPSSNNPTSSSSSGAAGGGGAGGGGSTGGMGGAGGGVSPECTTPADCTNEGTANFCGEPACESGKCVRKALQPEGTPLPSQVYGDCQEMRCDANAQPAPVNNDDDVYNDGNECTDDVCAEGVALHNVQTQGFLCSAAGICNDTGQCVQCIDGVQGCFSGNQMCMQGVCVGINCSNGIKNPGEGDVDCGGNCLPCEDGKTCTNGSQCKSGVCTGGMCAAPTCTDTVKNGNETGYDCGGADCPPCATDEGCQLPTDCQSGVCMDVFCAAPSCTDALQNGEETGIDCGGPMCDPCK